MKTKNKCVSREVMIKALKTGIVPFNDHLRKCHDCRELFDFLSSIGIPTRRPLEKPSGELISRYSLIPLLSGSYKPNGTIVGAVV